MEKCYARIFFWSIHIISFDDNNDHCVCAQIYIHIYKWQVLIHMCINLWHASVWCRRRIQFFFIIEFSIYIHCIHTHTHTPFCFFSGILFYNSRIQREKTCKPIKLDTAYIYVIFLSSLFHMMCIINFFFYLLHIQMFVCLFFISFLF